MLLGKFVGKEIMVSFPKIHQKIANEGTTSSFRVCGVRAMNCSLVLCVLRALKLRTILNQGQRTAKKELILFMFCEHVCFVVRTTTWCPYRTVQKNDGRTTR